jgi:dynein light intermediate chain
MRIRDNLKMTFAAYQTLYEGSLVFGNRKAHVAELGISDLEGKIEKLRKKKIELENQVIECLFRKYYWRMSYQVCSRVSER